MRDNCRCPKGRGYRCITHNKYIARKVVALFHDPFWKSIFMKRTSLLAYSCYGSASHEKAAFTALCYVLPSLPSNLRDKVIEVREHISHIKSSDHFAASVDREFIEEMWPKGIFLYTNCLLNIFRPSLFSKSRSIITGRDVYRFIWELRDYLEELKKNNVKKPNVYWNILLTLVEPLWFKDTSFFSPADTRVPHHSIFDHLFATASFAQWVISNNLFRGYLVYVSWTGFKEWISSSRKASDAWISSWSSSTLVWRAIKELVWNLGADILLAPSPRWNMLFMSLLKEKAEKGEIPKPLWEKMEKELNSLRLWEGFPYYSIQPAFAMLALPPFELEYIVKFAKGIKEGSSGSIKTVCEWSELKEGAKGLEELFEELLKEGWKAFVRGTLKGVLNSKSFSSEFKLFFKRVAELVEDVPPFKPLVVVVPVEYDAEKGILMVGNEVIDRDKLKEMFGIDTRKGIGKLAFAYAFYKFLTEIEKKKVEEYEKPKHSWMALDECELKELNRLANKLLKAREEDELWRSCSVCKYAFSVLSVPGKDEPKDRVSEDYKEFAKRVVGECFRKEEKDDDEESNEWRLLRPIIRPSERLCPFCLVKRLAGLPEIFKYVAEEVIGYRPEKEVSFPATDDFAALATKVAMLKAVKKIIEKETDDKVSEIVEKMMKALEKVNTASEIFENAKELLMAMEIKENDLKDAIDSMIRGRWWALWPLWREVREFEKKVEGVNREKLKLVLASLLVADAPFYNVYDENLREALRALASVEGLSKEERDALKSPRTYFGLLRFDADNMTLARMGSFKEGNEFVKAESYADEFVRGLRNCIRDKCYDWGLFHRYYERLKCLMMSLDCIDLGITVLPSPSFVFAMSHSLAYTLARFARIITRLGGVPVYLAGDEGLAFLPSYFPWEMVDESVREGYKRAVTKGLPEGLEPSSNATINAAIMIRRVWWGSNAKYPGFHPVRDVRMKKTLYYLPALVRNGLSMGIRFAHYKDHLYSEFHAVETLMEEAKKDKVKLSFGRGMEAMPEAKGKKRFELELGKGIREAAIDLMKANVLARLLEEGKATKGLLRGLDLMFLRPEEMLNEIGEDERALKGLRKYLVKQYVKPNVSDLVEELLVTKDVNELRNLLGVTTIIYESEVRGGA